jgi:hypothetical protein
MKLEVGPVLEAVYGKKLINARSNHLVEDYGW